MKNISETCNRFMRYEDWINHRLQEKMPPEFNSELKLIFSENPEAYSYYRNRLFYQLKLEKNENKIIDDFHNLLNKWVYDKSPF